MDREFPPLDTSDRKREFNLYSDQERASVVYHFLTDGMPTREMDRLLLHVDNSHGYQSFGIYRFLGLRKEHQGFFRNWQLADIIAFFHSRCSDPDLCLVFYYFLDYLDSSSFSQTDLSLIDDARVQFPEADLKDQSWIRNVWVADSSDIDKRLLDLPDTDGRQGTVTVRRQTVHYSSSTVKESIKSLYDYRCQVCGDTILKTGWNSTLGRVDSWRFMSSDVHHILPLSKKGPDLKSNMLCLCPSCHRKFHSGEFRLKEKASSLLVSDELLGKVSPLLSQRHNIVLY